MWSQDLAEDEEPNWPFPGEMLAIHILDGDAVVASADFSRLRESHGGHLACFNVNVLESHRRRGLATAMYDAAEERFAGDMVLPYPGNEGGAISDFWVARLKDEPYLLDRYRQDIGGAALLQPGR